MEIEAYTGLMGKIKKKEWLYGLLGMAAMLLTNIVMYGILIYDSFQGMPISSFTMYVFLISALMTRMVELGNDLAFIRNEGQYVDDFFRLMDADLINEGEADRLPDSVEIRFDHMYFKYPNTDKYIYEDFNFTIKRGERLAIVGVNGAGKTTLVKLMCGLYKPTSGHIYINDIDITDTKRKLSMTCLAQYFRTLQSLPFL